jgi:hypothetical protein
MTLFNAQGQEIVSGVVITPEDLQIAFQMALKHPQKDVSDIIEVRHPQMIKILARGNKMTPEDAQRYNATASRLRFRNLGNDKLVMLNKVVVISHY